MRYDKETIERYEERLAKMPVAELDHELRQAARANTKQTPLLTVLRVILKSPNLMCR